MPDFHLETIHFLNALLKAKQAELARAAHKPEYPLRREEFENLRSRLCLEIVYAMSAGH